MISDSVSRSYLLAEYDRQHQGPPGGARKIIEEAPSAQQWTPCESRHYPDEEENVLVCSDTGNMLDEVPSAQPKIIFCKDCKFYNPMNRETKTGICNLTMHQNFGDNWFCAGAERRRTNE